MKKVLLALAAGLLCTTGLVACTNPENNKNNNNNNKNNGGSSYN